MLIFPSTFFVNSSTGYICCSIVTPLLLEAGVSRRRGFMGHLTRIANSLVGNHVKNSNTEKLEHLVESTMNISSLFIVLVYCS